MTCWQSFKSTKTHGDVIEQLKTASAAEISERRQYLHRIVAATTFLGKQGIPFRGHDEQESSQNQGNFIECMKLLKQFDPFLQEYTPPSHTTYLSHFSQNEMITSISQEITESIIKQMKIAKMYSVMADEARDGCTEQLAVCVRFVTQKGVVRECFLGLRKLQGFDAKSIADEIEAMLQSHNLGDLLCVAQAYDGASVMSGAVGGVQSRFRERHPEAVYVHCYAHELNLVLCYTCKAIPEATAFFELLENVYTFFSNSLVNHNKFIEIQKQLGLRPSELVQLSTTRWACQVRSVNAVLNNLSAILACLSNMNTSMALGIRSKLCKTKTLYMLVMFSKLLGITEGLHRYLQGESLDLGKAVQYKTAVLQTLTELRTDSGGEDVFRNAMALCEANDIQLHVGPRQKQKRYDSFVVESACGSTSNLTTSDEFKQQLFYPCLDRMVEELTRRFSGLGEALMSGIHACNPTTETFLSEEALKSLASHYKIQLKPEELLVAKSFINRRMEKETVPDTSTVFQLLDEDMFPTLKALFQVALTIPVSSCSCERSFSALRRLHTWLRNTMGQDRLNDLAIMSIEKDNLNDINPDSVIDRFAQLKPRRYSLMLPQQK
ncbi:zinc finger MYM-type protein 1-like [Siphateles boraxobius]|uniref:zinc finger MYM-type protein 1-like n=1 Tax=Siphateles boraxobius TaxID=180520 RepID=UPI004062ECC4